MPPLEIVKSFPLDAKEFVRQQLALLKVTNATPTLVTHLVLDLTVKPSHLLYANHPSIHVKI
jgi:hypothetical protein